MCAFVCNGGRIRVTGHISQLSTNGCDRNFRIFVSLFSFTFGEYFAATSQTKALISILSRTLMWRTTPTMWTSSSRCTLRPKSNGTSSHRHPVRNVNSGDSCIRQPCSPATRCLEIGGRQAPPRVANCAEISKWLRTTKFSRALISVGV